MRHTEDTRRSYLDLIDRVGQHWLTLFAGDSEFYSTAYWDLFTGLWSIGRPVRKTEALAAMKGLRSAHTAGKYLDAAIRRGLVHEQDNPADARSKLVYLDPAFQAELNRFFDLAVEEVRNTAAALDRADPPARSSS